MDELFLFPASIFTLPLNPRVDSSLGDLATLKFDFQPGARVSLRLFGGMEKKARSPSSDHRLPLSRTRSVRGLVRR